MGNPGISGLVLIVANVLFSYQGLKDDNFQDRYSFEVDKILIRKDYKRLITSGFLHGSWTHLLFNMITLYLFYSGLESFLDTGKFLLLYFVSLVGGNLLALFVHRHHGEYSAIGASGAISGVVFASIALFPGMELGLLGLPIFIPSWAYGLLYVLYSVYGIKSKRDNIGHEAHLGGGIAGMLMALIFYPKMLTENYLPILLILIPSLAFLYLIITRPAILLTDTFFKKPVKYHNIEEKYNSEKREREKELDAILEKIHRRGMNSLSSKEKEKLDKYSSR
jgi:membrane associated rhomboid family serine protease